MKTDLGRVRGLGSAKTGTHHWWVQRISAIAMAILMSWFVVSLLGLIGADYAAAVAWVRNPVVAILLLLLIGTAFYHMRLGLQVVIEDYLTGAMRIAGIVALNFGSATLAAACLFSVLKVSFGA